MKKTILFFLFIIIMISITACSKEENTVKLTSEQQALVNSFYNNRDLWETRIGEDGEVSGKKLYCYQMQLYRYGENNENIGVNCGYSNFTNSNNMGTEDALGGAAKFIITYEPLAFRVTTDTVELIGGTQMIDTQKTPQELWPIGSCYYFFDDDENEKIKKLSSMFCEIE